MKKQISCLLVSLFLIAGLSLPISASDSSALEKAEALYSLGLFKGSDSGYELERQATRGEAAVMLIRVLGQDEKSKAQQYSHPFTDIPSGARAWAGYQIAWLYENNLVNGIGGAKYGFYESITDQQFITMLLRALGYSDSRGDFKYTDAAGFAVSINMIDENYKASINGKALCRGDMVELIYAALKTNTKYSRYTLARKLCRAHVFSEDDAVKAGILELIDPAGYFSTIELINDTMKLSSQGDDWADFSFDTPIETYGSHIFVSADGGLYEEISYYSDLPYTVRTRHLTNKWGQEDKTAFVTGFRVSNLEAGHTYSFIYVLQSSPNGQAEGKSNIVVVEK